MATGFGTVGEVGGETKRSLIAGADALLFPIEWDEPFGLVMVEALAAGTPVIGFRRASVPEVIDDGRTGFVVDDVDGMAAAIGRLGEIDRAACRRVAEERFTVARMVDDVEGMYRAVVNRAAVAVGCADAPGLAGLDQRGCRRQRPRPAAQARPGPALEAWPTVDRRRRRILVRRRVGGHDSASRPVIDRDVVGEPGPLEPGPARSGHVAERARQEALRPHRPCRTSRSNG